MHNRDVMRRSSGEELNDHHAVQQDAKPKEQKEERGSLLVCGQKPFELRMKPQTGVRERRERDRDEDEQKKRPAKEKYAQVHCGEEQKEVKGDLPAAEPTVSERRKKPSQLSNKHRRQLTRVYPYGKTTG